MKIGDGFVANVGKNLVNGLGRATINSALTGTDLETNLKTEVVAGLLSAASAQGANWVGDQTIGSGLFVSDAGKINEFGRAISHAIVGCMAGAAGASASGSNTSTGSGCGAGALGAVVGELSAGFYNSGRAEAGLPPKTDTVAFASMMSGIAAAATGQGAEGVAIAVATGANAAQNNWLNHADAEQLKKLRQQQQAGQCDTVCEQSIAGLELLDKLNNRALLNACVNGTVAECTAQVNRDPAALKYGVDNAGKIAFGRVIGQADTNVGKALASLGQALAKTELKPLVDANGVITGWAVDLGGADPDTLRYWLGAGVYVGAGIILPTSAIDLIPGAGKGLKVVTRGTERLVVEEASGKVLGKIGDASKVVADDVVAGAGRSYWTTKTEFEGIKVFPRNDVFDPNLVTSWRDGGKVVSGTNLERMATGRAPIGADGKSVNLHHMLQSNDSAIAEVTQTFHQQNSKVIHINPNTIPSGIDRPAFDAWKARYWINRSTNYGPQ